MCDCLFCTQDYSLTANLSCYRGHEAYWKHCLSLPALLDSSLSWPLAAWVFCSDSSLDAVYVWYSLSTSSILAYIVSPASSVSGCFRYVRKVLFGSENSTEEWNGMNVNVLPLLRAVDLSAIFRPNHGHQIHYTELRALQAQNKTPTPNLDKK